MKLWLDDERPAPRGWVWARDFDEAVSFCRGIDFTLVSLDHDLGGEKTGYDFLCFLEERFVEGGTLPLVRIHTANPVGYQKMLATLKRIYERAGVDYGDTKAL